MSSILDALKKLEQKGEGALRIEVARSILQSNTPTENRSFRRLLPFVLWLLLGAAGAGTYLLWNASTDTFSSSVVERRAERPAPPAGGSVSSNVPAGRPGVEPVIPPSDPPAAWPKALVRPSPKTKTELPVALVLEDILFSPEPAERLAVLNGLPVMEGMEMEGGRIEEILPDRIRFFIGETLYDVYPSP